MSAPKKDPKAPKSTRKKHRCNPLCPWVRENVRGELRCGLATDARRLLRAACNTRHIRTMHLALNGLGKMIPKCSRGGHFVATALPMGHWPGDEVWIPYYSWKEPGYVLQHDSCGGWVVIHENFVHENFVHNLLKEVQS